MKESELIELLQSQRTEIDPRAKADAIAAAIAEFESAHSKVTYLEKIKNFFQGILKRLRPTRTDTTKREDSLMKTFTKHWLIGGLGSAAAVVTAFLLVGPTMPNLQKMPDANAPIDELRASSEASPSSPELAKLKIPSLQPARERLKAGDARRQAEPEAMSEELIVASLRQANNSAKELKREVSGAASGRSLAAEKSIPSKAHAPSIVGRTNSFSDAAVPVVEEHRDQFETVESSSVKKVSEQPVSTFSIDVDTASYSFVRSSLNSGALPQKAAVRIEEMLNYFDYQYPLPNNKSQPFKPSIVVTDSPWAKPGENKKLLHIGIKGYELNASEQPDSNLVFLLDVSGSMNSPNKLPLVKQSMQLLLSQLKPTDTVAIAVYAGAAGTVLEPTPVKEKSKIIAALNQLNAGGSTAGAEGIELAYQLAETHFNKNGVNRILLATDGDFNVGITNRDELIGYIEHKREKGIFLSVLGFGRGNYNDYLIQELAQNGNGVAAYIDTLNEAQKVLVTEATSSLFPIAKDVKIQMEFNPAVVSEYRLLGYETRALKREDFNNDKVDAGDIGAGHTVTAIYEIVLASSNAKQIDDLRYKAEGKPKGNKTGEYGFLKIRYKLPNEDTSRLVEQAITADAAIVDKNLISEVNFSTAVAGFAELLKGGQYQNKWGYQQALDLAQANKGADLYGYRTEFVQLIRMAMTASKM